jgi:YggT family protein
MMHSYLANPLEFLITTLISLYILAIMLRFLLGMVRADFYNPVSQFLVRITNPLLVPMRKVLPGIGKLDTSAIVLMLLLQMLSVFIMLTLRGANVPVLMLPVYAVGELVLLLINVFLVAIVVQVVVSWVNPGTYNAVNSLLYSLTSPLLKPIQRILPSMSGIDLAPLFAIIGLQVLRMLIMPLLG